jgi:hypothetical protein
MAKKEIPRRLVKPFLESVRDFNREAREIDPKKEAKRIKTQEDLEEIEELTMHAARIKGAADRR